MVTKLGLKLEYDNQHRASYNFYWQLFGEKPERGCPSEAEDVLLWHLTLVEHGENVKQFFWLSDYWKTEDWSEEDLAAVEAGLDELRTWFAREIKLLYTKGGAFDLSSLYRAVVRENNALRQQNRVLMDELAEQRGSTEGVEEVQSQDSILNTVFGRQIEVDGYPIKMLDLSARPSKGLFRAKINTVEQLLEKDVCALMSVRNMGEKTLMEIRLSLAKYRLHLKGDQQFLLDHYPLKHIMLRTRLLLPISRLELPSFVESRVIEAGMQRIGDLVCYSESELFRRIHAETLRSDQRASIHAALESAGLDFCSSQIEAVASTTLVLTLEGLNLSNSLIRLSLYDINIMDLSTLLNMTEHDLKKRDFSPSAIDAIKQALAEQGLGLFPHDPWAIGVGLV